MGSRPEFSLRCIGLWHQNGDVMSQECVDLNMSLVEDSNPLIMVQQVDVESRDVTKGDFENTGSISVMFDNDRLLQGGCPDGVSPRALVEPGDSDTAVLFWVGNETPNKPDGVFSGETNPWNFVTMRVVGQYNECTAKTTGMLAAEGCEIWAKPGA